MLKISVRKQVHKLIVAIISLDDPYATKVNAINMFEINSAVVGFLISSRADSRTENGTNVFCLSDVY